MDTGVNTIAQHRAAAIQRGHNIDHDRQHESGELLRAAQVYLVEARRRLGHLDDEAAAAITHVLWPWDGTLPWEKETEPVFLLAEAGALIAAEIDRQTFGQEDA